MQKGKVAVITGDRRPITIEIAQGYSRGPTDIVCTIGLASAEKHASLINGNIYPERLDVTVIL